MATGEQQIRYCPVVNSAISVVHATSSWLPRTENWIYKQIKYLPESFENHIVCQVTENLGDFPTTHLHVMPRPWYQRLPGLKALAWHAGARPASAHLLRVARNIGADLIQSHFGQTGWLNLATAERTSTPHVVRFYGYDMSLLPHTEPVWLDRYLELFKRVNRVLVEGPAMARGLAGLGCPEEKIRIHRLGVDVEAMPWAPRQRQPGEPLRVLMAASFREKKGLVDAVQAIALAAAQVPIEATLIGDAGPSPETQAEKDRILAAIEDSSLAGKIRLLGYQPEEVLAAEALRAHVFLHPSRTARNGDSEGGSPVVLTQMLASGLVCVSTRHADIPEVIRDGAWGLLADEGDVQELAHHLIWVAHHPGVQTSWAEAGRAHVNEKFNARHQGEALAELYREVLA